MKSTLAKVQRDFLAPFYQATCITTFVHFPLVPDVWNVCWPLSDIKYFNQQMLLRSTFELNLLRILLWFFLGNWCNVFFYVLINVHDSDCWEPNKYFFWFDSFHRPTKNPFYLFLIWVINVFAMKLISTFRIFIYFTKTQKIYMVYNC